MSWDDSIPLLTLLTSLIPAALIFMLREERLRTRTALNMAGATLKLVLIGVMLWGVFREHRYEFRFPVAPGMDFILRADALAMFFVTLSGLLWFLTTLYAIAYLEGAPHRSRFFGFFSLCVSATVGIALAGNLFTFVTFYELLTLATYPLVVHRETAVSRRAGRVYLAYTLTGGALLLVGAAWLHTLVPAVDFNGGASLAPLGSEHHAALRIIFVLLIVGMGVKAALVPLHGWLPQAMVAPAPVSALLHAVAVVKAGAFGIVRVFYDVYGIDRAHALGLTTPVAAWAAVTIVYGSLRALFQDDLKRRLAYSTVSQVSYIALGVALFGPSSTVGGIAHLVHQGLMKITLFFCAGNLAETLGIRNISEMHGVGRRMPWTMAAFTAGALGMIGVPPTVGFISKWHLGAGAVETSQHWVLFVLAASSALNAAYFLPILYIAWFCEPRGRWTERMPQQGAETKWALLMPPLATAALATATGLMAGTPFSPLQWTMLVVERTYGRDVIDRGLVDVPALFSAGGLLLLSALAAPLAAACLVVCRRLPGLALRLASLSALPAVVLAFRGEPGTAVDLNWLLLHMHLELDSTGQAFLVFTSLLWLFAGIYARGYLAGDRRAPRFFFFFLLTMTGNLGLVLSNDMASFYLFFAMMSLSAYPLVVHQGDDDALRAGRVYVVLVVAGEIALLSAMLLSSVARDSLLFDRGMTVLATDPARHAIVGLFLIGFGIKAGVVPLHVWLPLAHPAAPAPASAVLSGAMIKAGLLGWLRFLPLGEAAFPDWGNVCLVAGLVTAFYGVIVGVTQHNAKAVLAYSSISQMGLLTLGIGVGLSAPAAWPVISAAVLIYALHHGLSKGCLFLSVGVARGSGRTSGPSRDGLEVRPTIGATGKSARPATAWLMRIGLVIPALALAGAPLTMGAVGKSGLKQSLTATLTPGSSPIGRGVWGEGIMLDVLLPLASVGTTLLMARFLYLIWPRAAETASPAIVVRPSRLPAVWSQQGAGGTPAPQGEFNAESHDQPAAPSVLFAWSALLLSVLTAAWLIPTSLDAGHAARLLWATTTWSNLWPVGLGCAVAWCAWRLSRFQQFRPVRFKSRAPSIPAGDLVVPWLKAQRLLVAFVRSSASELKPGPLSAPVQPDVAADGSRFGRIVQSGESTLARWPWIAVSLGTVLGICLLLWFCCRAI